MALKVVIWRGCWLNFSDGITHSLPQQGSALGEGSILTPVGKDWPQATGSLGATVKKWKCGLRPVLFRMGTWKSPLRSRGTCHPSRSQASASSPKTMVPALVCRVLMTTTSCVVFILFEAWLTTSMVPSGR